MTTIYNKNRGIVEKSENLTQFCLRNSKQIVFTRRHEGSIDGVALKEIIENELIKIESRRKCKIKKIEELCKNDINAMGFRNKKQFEKRIEAQFQMEKQAILSYQNHCDGKSDTLESKLNDFGLCKRTLNFGSFFTWPDIWDFCFFPVEYIDKYTKVNTIFFDTEICIGEYEFEDFGFVTENGNIWAKVCPHEEYFQFDLNRKQFIEFKKLNIPFQILS